MTYQEYINNPTGVGNSVMSYRKMYEDLYHNKWDKVMVRENGKVDYTLYYDSKSYYCHIKIPSEVVEDFYYDVVIKMIPDNKSGFKSLKNCETHFFSNDPSFNYTFAYAFVKHKLHIPELESKMSKQAIHKKANEKNPDATIGYVKSLFFAFIAMENKGLFNPVKYKSEGKKFNKKILLSNIMDTEDCIEQRQELGEKARKKKEEVKPKKSPTSFGIDPEVKNGGWIGSITPKTHTNSSRVRNNTKRIGSVQSRKSNNIKTINKKGGKR